MALIINVSLLQADKLIKQRDRYLDPNYSQEKIDQMASDMRNDIQEFSKVVGTDFKPARLSAI